MEVKAVSKYVRISPFKVRKIRGAIKGKPVEAGLNALKFMPQKAAGIVEKTLRSAIANAEQKHPIDPDVLFIEKLTVDGGPVYQRFMPRAQGRATPIDKKTSHISLQLAVR